MMQVKNAKGEWIDIGEFGSGGFIEYREKPEKKPDVVRYTFLKQCGGTVYNESAYHCISLGANICLTFCGETGKLIKAEVL